MDGYKTCKTLKKLMEEGKLFEIYIVAYTAAASTAAALNEIMEKCHESQFDEVRFKPLIMAGMKRLLAKCFK